MSRETIAEKLQRQIDESGEDCRSLCCEHYTFYQKLDVDRERFGFKDGSWLVLGWKVGGNDGSDGNDARGLGSL